MDRWVEWMVEAQTGSSQVTQRAAVLGDSIAGRVSHFDVALAGLCRHARLLRAAVLSSKPPRYPRPARSKYRDRTTRQFPSEQRRTLASHSRSPISQSIDLLGQGLDPLDN